MEEELCREREKVELGARGEKRYEAVKGKRQCSEGGPE